MQRASEQVSGGASTSKADRGRVHPSGGWRLGGAAAASAAVATSAYLFANVALPIATCWFPNKWRSAILQVLATPGAIFLALLQLIVFGYWRCLVSRTHGRANQKQAAAAAARGGGAREGHGAAGGLAISLLAKPQPLLVEISAFFVLLFLVAKVGCGGAATDLEVASLSAAHWTLWVVVRMQFGSAPPLFPAIEGRTRFFRVKSRLGVAAADTLRTAVMAAANLVALKLFLATSALVFGAGASLGVGFGSVFHLRPLVHPTVLCTCWLMHVALHATEVVATERFRYCRVVHSGGQAAVLGMDELMRALEGSARAIDRELAFLDACLLAEKSKYWRNALFTYSKGDYWYNLTRVIHQDLTFLECHLIEASREGTGAKDGANSGNGGGSQQQRAFLNAKNIHSIAETIRDNQFVFTWSVRLMAALTKACAREDPLGVSQRHSRKPSLQDLLVTSVSLYALLTSLEVQLAQASGKQAARPLQLAVHAVTGVNALGGDMETIYTNVWAMRDSLKLCLYATVRALGKKNVETIAERESAQHAHILGQILAHNL